MPLEVPGVVAGALVGVAAGGQTAPRGICATSTRTGAGVYVIACTQAVLLGATHYVLATILSNGAGIVSVFQALAPPANVLLDVRTFDDAAAATDFDFTFFLFEIPQAG